MRTFEKISYTQFAKDFASYDGDDLYNKVMIPTRHTKSSAGYDFHAIFDFILNPGEMIKVPTGIKVSMETDEFLMIVVRSSTGFKYNVRLCNQVGIIDADYYNNDNNNGHMWLAFQNHGTEPWEVNTGDRIAQGIFVKYLLTDDDPGSMEIRKGGSGTNNIRSEENE